MWLKTKPVAEPEKTEVRYFHTILYSKNICIIIFYFIKKDQLLFTFVCCCEGTQFYNYKRLSRCMISSCA